MKDGQRFRIDDLRRFAAGLAASVGLAPTRAAAFATHLLWYDAAGATELGIASLPAWLERMVQGEFDLATEARVVSEHAGTLVLDGQRGIPPLLLARAAALAEQKARDVGIGLVRLMHVGAVPSAAEVAAEIAIGPAIAVALGPDSAWTLALPSAQGLPAVFDSGLARVLFATRSRSELAAVLAPWNLLAPERDWLVAVIVVNGFDSLAAFHERLTSAMKSDGACPGALKPEAWEAHRSEVRQRGVSLSESTRHELARWAAKFGFDLPEPCSVSPS